MKEAITIFAMIASILWIVEFFIGLFQKSWEKTMVPINEVARNFSIWVGFGFVVDFVLYMKKSIDMISSKLV